MSYGRFVRIVTCVNIILLTHFNFPSGPILHWSLMGGYLSSTPQEGQTKHHSFLRKYKTYSGCCLSLHYEQRIFLHANIDVSVTIFRLYTHTKTCQSNWFFDNYLNSCSCIGSSWLFKASIMVAQCVKALKPLLNIKKSIWRKEKEVKLISLNITGF